MAVKNRAQLQKNFLVVFILTFGIILFIVLAFKFRENTDVRSQAAVRKWPGRCAYYVEDQSSIRKYCETFNYRCGGEYYTLKCYGAQTSTPGTCAWANFYDQKGVLRSPYCEPERSLGHNKPFCMCDNTKANLLPDCAATKCPYLEYNQESIKSYCQALGFSCKPGQSYKSPIGCYGGLRPGAASCSWISYTEDNMCKIPYCVCECQ